MSEEFASLVSRARRGDAGAAEELVRRYEPEMRIVARVRLRDAGLRRVLDSMDVCQSVLANFFARVSAGQFDFSSPEDLVKLLATMVRNKVRDKCRRHGARKRDGGRIAAEPVEDLDIGGTDETPSVLVAGAELVQQFRERFTAEEREIADQRTAGLEWDEVARSLGGNHEALRKRLSRAVNRIARELNLDPAEYE